MYERQKNSQNEYTQSIALNLFLKTGNNLKEVYYV